MWMIHCGEMNENLNEAVKESLNEGPFERIIKRGTSEYMPEIWMIKKSLTNKTQKLWMNDQRKF